MLTQVLLAPLAGLLAVTAGFGWGFRLNAVSFALIAVLLRGLRATETARPVSTAAPPPSRLRHRNTMMLSLRGRIRHR